jgi:hypothetical protein
MAAVPTLLDDLARQWNLVTDGELFWHGCNAVVFPVRQGSRPLALKLAWPAGQARGEADALAEWRRRGPTSSPRSVFTEPVPGAVGVVAPASRVPLSRNGPTAG